MEHTFPEKDIAVAAKLIGKLAAAQAEFGRIKEDFENVSAEYIAAKKKTEVRGAYIDVLAEIAQEIGEEIDPHENESLGELESRMEKSREVHDALQKEISRLTELADKLKSNSPELYELAASYGKGEESPQKPKKEAPAPEPAAPRPQVDRNPAKLKEVFELDRLKANRQLKKRGNVSPTLVFDAFNVIQLVKRYQPNAFRSLDECRDVLVCDLDYLAGQLGIPISVVFDTAYATQEKIENELKILASNSRTSPDKSAGDRQIIRLLEEAQLERKPMVLVTNDASLTRDAHPTGAILLTLQEVFRDA
ncbi:MAG: NYN domain-containing protein [bacterium]|jgi:predicted RNA-binding protein with PIN domain